MFSEIWCLEFATQPEYPDARLFTLKSKIKPPPQILYLQLDSELAGDTNSLVRCPAQCNQ